MSNVTSVKQAAAGLTELWSPRVVAEVDDAYVKVAKVQGSLAWHSHESEDELFFVLKGQLRIELEQGSVDLKEGEMFVVPKVCATIRSPSTNATSCSSTANPRVIPAMSSPRRHARLLSNCGRSDVPLIGPRLFSAVRSRTARGPCVRNRANDPVSSARLRADETALVYSCALMPLPPISFGRSFIFGKASLMGRTVSW